MNLPKLFIFDMDGLLLDSEAAFMNTLAEVMVGYGYTMTREFYVQTLGLTAEDTRKVVERVYGPDCPFDAIYVEGRKRQNQKAAARALPVKPGIPELLSWLKERGVPACVASSSPKKTVEIYLKTAGLLPFFDFIASGDDITHSKPNPEIFFLSCRHFGVDPAEALVLEDSDNGIRAAVNGGIPVICIPDMKQPEPELAKQTLCLLPDAFHVISRYETAAPQ